ncbi:UNVERIFIED_CONTAM: hypothetical protein GTU68_027426 [Idotea baltica]|nr:hypothetical protein [Idotea baltica]MCL4125687.1 hypothetical protein [Idotea baltica]
MSDSDTADNLRMQALPVGNFDLEKFDSSITPSTAEEYLQKVMWEAQQCQNIVTVKLDETQIRKQLPVVKKLQKMRPPTEFFPPQEMQRQFLAQFSQLRDKIERCRERNNFPAPPIKLPEEQEQEAWCILCFGNDFQRSLLIKKGKKEEEVPDLVEGKQPLLSILLNISPLTLENLVEWHANWLEVAGFSELQGRWLFSLLACLEKPLTPEMCSILRNVLQNCALVRASLDSAEHPHLLHLNMLITIIAKYFGQDDLADP